MSIFYVHTKESTKYGYPYHGCETWGGEAFLNIIQYLLLAGGGQSGVSLYGLQVNSYHSKILLYVKVTT